MGWRLDKERADLFLPDIKRRLIPHVLVTPRIEEDREHNTDLTLVTAYNRIAVRVRNAHHMNQFAKYWHEVTVRYSRPGRPYVEYGKMLAGFGDLMIYAFGDHTTRKLLCWTVLDLAAIRAGLQQRLFAPGGPISNKDGTEFVAFSLHHLARAPGVIIEHAYSSRKLVTWERKMLMDLIQRQRCKHLAERVD